MTQTRNTAQRKLVLQILEDKSMHPTADEVYEIARAKDAHISRGTIYRNLNLLTDQGVIRKLPMPTGPDHFDLETENHYHFQCRSCNKVFDIHLPYNEEFNLQTPAVPGFKTEWHRLIMVGLCPDCNQANGEQ